MSCPCQRRGPQPSYQRCDPQHCELLGKPRLKPSFVIIPTDERVQAYDVVPTSDGECHSNTFEVWRGRLEGNISR